jgi:branched-chain amino acid aminotransferase
VEIEMAVLDTIKVNKLANARVRITVSPGEGAINAEPASCQQPTLLVITEGYKPYPQQIYSKGLRAVLSKIRRNSQSGLSQMKSTSYLQSIMARQEARAAAADEAICLNEKGLLAEAGMSNIFLVTDSMLKTPHLESGIMPGITRQAILELAFKLGIKNLECDIKSEELYRAQEAFLTGSLIEVMPLIAVDDTKIGNAKPGPVTCRLMTAYGELVVSELEIR